MRLVLVKLRTFKDGHLMVKRNGSRGCARVQAIVERDKQREDDCAVSKHDLLMPRAYNLGQCTDR